MSQENVELCAASAARATEATGKAVIRLRDGLAIRWDFSRTEEEARSALAG